MSKWTREELEQMMFDTVDELYPYLTEKRAEDYGQNGYPVNELVRKVMEDISSEIRIIMLENKAHRSGLKVTLIDLDKLDAIAGLNPIK